MFFDEHVQFKSLKPGRTVMANDIALWKNLTNQKKYHPFLPAIYTTSWKTKLAPDFVFNEKIPVFFAQGFELVWTLIGKSNLAKIKETVSVEGLVNISCKSIRAVGKTFAAFVAKV